MERSEILCLEEMELDQQLKVREQEGALEEVEAEVGKEDLVWDLREVVFALTAKLKLSTRLEFHAMTRLVQNVEPK